MMTMMVSSNCATGIMIAAAILAIAFVLLLSGQGRGVWWK